eukprot:gene4774-8360_t
MSFFGSDLNPSIVSDDIEGIFVKKKKTWKPINPQTIYHEDDLSNDFQYLLSKDSEELTSSGGLITFTVGKDKVTISGHKTFISMRCKTLEKQKKNDSIEKEEFNLILEYIYTGKCNITFSQMDKIISISRKLNLKDLEEGIIEALMNDINEENIIDILNISIKDKELSKRIDEFLSKDIIKLFQHENLLKLNEKQLIYIISKNEINSPEILIFKAIKKWNDLNDSKNIKDILSHIRFGIMKERDFTNIVLPTHLVDSSIIDEVLEYFSSKKKPKNQILIKPRSIELFNWIVPNQFKDEIKFNNGEIIRFGKQYGSMYVYGEKPLPPKFEFNVILDHFSQKPGFCIGITKTPQNPTISNGIIILVKYICMALSGGRYNCSGKNNNTCNVNQIVGVKFDRDLGYVSFSRDDKDLELKGIISKGDYYPIIYTNSPKDQVTIEI